MSARALLHTNLVIIAVQLIIVGGFLWLVFPSLNADALGVVTGAVIGAFSGLIGGLAGNLAGVWAKDREVQELLRARVSDHALELTKLEYRIRPMGFEDQEGKHWLYAPAKMHREFYRALLELYAKDNWPRSIEGLGFMNLVPTSDQIREVKRVEDVGPFSSESGEPFS